MTAVIGLGELVIMVGLHHLVRWILLLKVDVLKVVLAALFIFFELLKGIEQGTFAFSNLQGVFINISVPKRPLIVVDLAKV